MTETDSQKVLLGALLLLAGSAIIVAFGLGFSDTIPGLVGSVAAMGLAAGALLVGTSESGRPV